MEEIRTPLPQQPGKEAVAEKTGELLPMEFPSATTAAVPKAAPAPKAKKIESVKPFPRKLSLRKKKEQTPELISEEAEESTEDSGSSGGGADTEEEPEPSTPRTEGKARVDTRSSDRKKPASAFKTPVTPKQPTRTPRKGESSLKKPKGK